MSDDPTARPPMNREALNRLDDEVAQLNPRCAALEAANMAKAAEPVSTGKDEPNPVLEGVGNSTLDQILKRLGRTVAARAERARQAQDTTVATAPPPEPQTPPESPPVPEPVLAPVIRLPLFPSETRPAVNTLTGSSLFAAIQGKDRQMLKNAKIQTPGETEILFTGEQFNQDDHNVLMQLVFMTRDQPLGAYVTVSAHALLTALGRGTSGKEHHQLKAEIERLVAGTVKVKTPKFDYIGHLIDDAVQDKESKHWVFRLNPSMAPFYHPDAYTLMDWEQRKQLKGKDLARWVQLEIARHAQPFPVKVETWHRMSGSQTQALREFRRMLKAVLAVLARPDIGALKTGYIDPKTDLIHLERGEAITASQQRHLTLPAPRKPRRKSGDES